jgi:N-acetylglutamate synthase-like GNAT family acetyltransferase
LKIAEPYSPEEYKKYFNARWEILRKPLGFPKGSEIDDSENISLHIMAVEAEEVAGVGRLTYYPNGEGQIRYMGVSDKFRNQKVGTSILEYLEKEAKKMGLTKIFLNARENALLFYSKLGYRAKGKPFEGVGGISHTKMIKEF